LKVRTATHQSLWHRDSAERARVFRKQREKGTDVIEVGQLTYIAESAPLRRPSGQIDLAPALGRITTIDDRVVRRVEVRSVVAVR